MDCEMVWSFSPLVSYKAKEVHNLCSATWIVGYYGKLLTESRPMLHMYLCSFPIAPCSFDKNAQHGGYRKQISIHFTTGFGNHLLMTAHNNCQRSLAFSLPNSCRILRMAPPYCSIKKIS